MTQRFELCNDPALIELARKRLQKMPLEDAFVLALLANRVEQNYVEQISLRLPEGEGQRLS